MVRRLVEQVFDTQYRSSGSPQWLCTSTSPSKLRERRQRGELSDQSRLSVSLAAMKFDGRVWFDFANPEVWQFYKFVLALAEDGNGVGLEWVPLYRGTETEAMATFISLPTPQDRGRFLHAMLGLVHIEKLDPLSSATVAKALEAAECVTPETVGDDALDDITEKASAMGVSETPTLFTGGPVMHIVLNQAATMGNLVETGETILAVLESDGIWTLAKP
jgi:hypothetical protein